MVCMACSLQAQRQAQPVVAASATETKSACVAAIGLSSVAVTGGSGVSGTVMLSAPAPPEGLSIRLASGHPTARVAEVVTAQPGQAYAEFIISTLPVASILAVPITAIAGACSVSTPVMVHPPVLVSVALSAVASRGNASLTGMTTLSGPAPTGGVVVKLQSSDPIVTVPVEVTIPAGETGVSFAVRIGASISLNSVAITASYGQSVENALLSVAPGI